MRSKGGPENIDVFGGRNAIRGIYQAVAYKNKEKWMSRRRNFVPAARGGDWPACLGEYCCQNGVREIQNSAKAIMARLFRYGTEYVVNVFAQFSEFGTSNLIPLGQGFMSPSVCST